MNFARALLTPIREAARVVRPYVTTTTAGALTWLLVRLVLPHLAALASFSIPTSVPWTLLYLGSLFLVVLWLVPALYRHLVRWGHRRALLPRDCFLLGLLVAAIIDLALCRQDTPSIVDTSIPAIAFVLLLGRALATWVSLSISVSSPQIVQSTSAVAFDQIIGDAGFSPLADFSNDQLGRRPLVDTLDDLLASRKGKASLCVGLDGTWGSGKTTILDELARRHESRGTLVVRFNAWNFRDPDRVVRAYFSLISASLRKRVLLPGFVGILRRTAAGLAEATGSRASAVFHALFADWSADSPDVARRDLTEALRAFGKPLLVVVDDLDRLETEELRAALRAIRLMTDLPYLTHILAYDRDQLTSALFPDDRTGSSGRDYLAKIVNVEFALATPSVNAVLAMLDAGLKPLLAMASVEEQEEFRRRFQEVPYSLYAEALPTPREVRRIAAATAALWARLARLVNLYDLFILTILQYRLPAVYQTVHSHPEWFVETEWAKGWLRLSDKDRLDEERKQLAQEYSSASRRESVIAFRILAVLFPGILNTPAFVTPTNELEARTTRRIVHPRFFQRYFQFGIEPGNLPEYYIDDLADGLRGADAGVARQTLLVEAFEEVKAKNVLSTFLEDWPVLMERLKPAEPLDPVLVADLAVALARATSILPVGTGGPDAPRNLAAYRAMDLISRLPDDPEATDLTVRVVETADSLGFAGLLTFYAGQEDQRRSVVYGNRRPNYEKVVEAFDRRVAQKFRTGGEEFFKSSDDDFVAALFWGRDKSVVRDRIVSELQTNPLALTRLLDSVIKVGRPFNDAQVVVLQGSRGAGSSNRPGNSPRPHESDSACFLESRGRSDHRENFPGGNAEKLIICAARKIPRILLRTGPCGLAPVLATRTPSADSRAGTRWDELPRSSPSQLSRFASLGRSSLW